MCRLLAYQGDPIALSAFLLEAEHSLQKQAWQPQELREATLNADGYGFAWYKLNRHNDNNNPEQLQSQQQAMCYRNTLPIWNDHNLADLSQTLIQPLWLAYVRSATPGLGVSLQNTQPFIYKQWSFLHNGYILDFQGKLQHQLSQHLQDEFLYLINGNTDSEIIFALLMQCLNTQAPADALRQCINIIQQVCANTRSLLNICISDGNSIYAIRHAINGESPTLYYSHNSKAFGSNYHLLVSERLNNEDAWHSIDEHSLITLHKNKPCEIHSL